MRDIGNREQKDLENLWSGALVLTKPLFWKIMLVYGALKGERGQAWEGIMAEHVLCKPPGKRA